MKPAARILFVFIRPSIYLRLADDGRFLKGPQSLSPMESPGMGKSFTCDRTGALLIELSPPGADLWEAGFFIPRAECFLRDYPFWFCLLRDGGRVIGEV